MTRTRWIQLVAALVLVGVLIAISVAVGVPGVGELRRDFARFGAWGGVVFAGLYAAVTLTPLPASVFTLAAGTLFGIGEGTLVALAGATGGAVAGFALARVLGRDFVARATKGAVVRADERLAARGVWGVLAIRLVPVLPFAPVNFVLGLSSISLRDYFIGTVFGIMPATVTYVALGAYGSKPGSLPFLLALAALALLLLVGLIQSRRSRRVRTTGGGATEPVPG